MHLAQVDDLATIGSFRPSWEPARGDALPVQPVEEAIASESLVPIHPLGVRPLGNRFLSSVNAKSSAGAIQILPDETLSILLEYLDLDRLVALGATCKFLYAFCHWDELWKSIYLELDPLRRKDIGWRGTWRQTVLSLPPWESQVKVDCSNVFSDVLHRPFLCSHISLSQYAHNIPRANAIRRFNDLNYEEFASQWSSTPFVLTEPVKQWPVYRQWTLSSLLEIYRQVDFRAESVDWPFSRYHDYMTHTRDESPLYLFDKNFAEKMDLAIGKPNGAYWKPDCFGPDLFELLEDERPAHRWLIIGPERSGSTFHKDPNATSAWNAVIEGSKYWIMFPPSAQVPGVYVSKDNSEVTSPLSIAEWLLEFHKEARLLPGCIEGVCAAGEVLHVPSGWWHLVVNLENGIALTQNFVPESHVADAIDFLRGKPEQVTGFRKDIQDPYLLFVERLQKDHPDLLAKATLDLQRRRDTLKRKWDDAVADVDAEEGRAASGGFSFGFESEDED